MFSTTIVRFKKAAVPHEPTFGPGTTWLIFLTYPAGRLEQNRVEEIFLIYPE